MKYMEIFPNEQAQNVQIDFPRRLKSVSFKHASLVLNNVWHFKNFRNKDELCFNLIILYGSGN